MNDATKEKASLKQRIKHEMWQYWINFVYLAIFFVTFAWYRRFILAEYHMSYFHFGAALVKALVLAKVILIGDALGLSRGYEDKPLVYPTLRKAVVFALFVGFFTIVEHAILGLLQGMGVMGGLAEIWNEGRDELIAGCLVTFFAFRELALVLDEGKLLSLFFHRKTPASAYALKPYAGMAMNSKRIQATEMKAHHHLRAFISVAAYLVLGLPSFAQDAPKSVTVFSNVRIFDGKSDQLSSPSHVLVRGNIIEKISTSPIPADRRADTKLIDCGGRTLMPGLIDAHWHTMLVRPRHAELLAADIGYLNLQAGVEARDTLMRGFTTVRDLGGPSFGLKRAIDEGVIAGPRIYPCGAVITVTGGHGDFRQATELPRTIGAPLSRGEQIGAAAIADSPDEVRVRVREQLMLGATQIKLTAGGGVASPHSPLDASTFTEAELRAAVEAAENWGTYVTVHAYTPVSIQRAIAAGVKCIEHGHLMDEPTAKLIADRGIWLSTQPFPDEMADVFPPGSQEGQKARQVFAGTETTYALAKKYKLKTAFGTDIVFSRELAPRQGELLAKLARWYTPAEALIMATGSNAELLAVCGKRNPYPGKLGVVEEGALADLLLVDGDPIADIKLVAEPAKSFLIIMKDGKIFKNALRPSSQQDEPLQPTGRSEPHL